MENADADSGAEDARRRNVTATSDDCGYPCDRVVGVSDAGAGSHARRTSTKCGGGAPNCATAVAAVATQTAFERDLE